MHRPDPRPPRAHAIAVPAPGPLGNPTHTTTRTTTRTTTHTNPAHPTPTTALLTAALALLLTLLAPALPARAHDFLISSTPADNQVFDAFPARVELEFTADIIPASPALLIMDSERAVVWEAVPELAGRVASAEFPHLEDGEYSLNWSLVSSDGHRVEGAIPFTLATGQSGTAPSPDDAAPSSPDSPPAPSSPDDGGTIPTDPSPAATDGPVGGLGDLPLATKIAIAVGALGAAAVVAILAFRRKDRGLGE
ncbi:MAG TPA: copper resistance protein CopC [Actinomycetales bacterium]|nr:copper resistance protein CopC [Actinomycetales bacterium]